MPNNDYILRSDAVEAMMTCRSLTGVAKLEAVNHIMPIPAADVEPVVRCRDCKYKPTAPEGITVGFQVEFPDKPNNPCPCNCGDGWFSEKPSDNFFCAYGAKINTKPPKEENDGTSRTD